MVKTVGAHLLWAGNARHAHRITWQAIACCTLCFWCASGLAAEKIPLAAWIHDPLISSVEVTPDGDQLVALTLSGINEPPEITVWQTNDLSIPPRRFKPVDVKALAVSWLNDKYLLVVGRQKFDIRVGGRPTRWFRDKVYIVDDRGKRFRELFEDRDALSISLFNRLPQHKDKVLVSLTNLEFAEDIYEVNLKNFVARRVYRGAAGDAFFADRHGEIRGKARLERAGKDTHIRYSYKNPSSGKWEEHYRLYAKEREGLTPIGFRREGREVYVLDNVQRERSVIRTYNLATRQLGDPLYGGGDVEALDVLTASDPENVGEVVGFLGISHKLERKYTEAKRIALQERLAKALPADQQHDWISMSDDLTIIVVESSGPKEAGAYYLLVNGKDLISLGRKYPLLTPDKMSDMRFVTYQARDGLEIPAYLTIPSSGERPFPAVVMPHGGPWARDILGWDLWAQFLANRGYAVLQPQYRGSEGFGQKLWRAGDNEWGQKMQDDKDDGVAWLVDQGIADEARVAIYGYSYGGFAAMAASVRRNSPFQCAVSGAGLAELRSFDKVTFENPFTREYQNPTISGMSPLDHVDDAEIPIFVMHGDRDQRVPIEQSRKFVRAMRRAGKDVKYLEIVDLWHSLPWWPQHHLAVLSSLEDYLANDCGPGGL